MACVALARGVMSKLDFNQFNAGSGVVLLDQRSLTPDKMMRSRGFSGTTLNSHLRADYSSLSSPHNPLSTPSVHRSEESLRTAAALGVQEKTRTSKTLPSFIPGESEPRQLPSAPGSTDGGSRSQFSRKGPSRAREVRTTSPFSPNEEMKIDDPWRFTHLAQSYGRSSNKVHQRSKFSAFSESNIPKYFGQ